MSYLGHDYDLFGRRKSTASARSMGHPGVGSKREWVIRSMLHQKTGAIPKTRPAYADMPETETPTPVAAAPQTADNPAETPARAGSSRFRRVTAQTSQNSVSANTQESVQQ